MFTGIIEDIGILKSTRQRSRSVSVEISTALPVHEMRPGESLAVDGVCLTIDLIGPGSFVADVSYETLRVTTMGQKKAGDRLHLERALAVGGRLNGHWVTGHVDAVGEIFSRMEHDTYLDLGIRVPSSLERYLIPKGSISIDGVSLTINEPQENEFRLTLVPHTLEKTIFSNKRLGDNVNVEADMIGKYLAHFIGLKGGARLDENFLLEHGFIASGSGSDGGS